MAPRVSSDEKSSKYRQDEAGTLGKKRWLPPQPRQQAAKSETAAGTLGLGATIAPLKILFVPASTYLQKKSQPQRRRQRSLREERRH